MVVGDGKNTESRSPFIDKQPLGVAGDTGHVMNILRAVSGAVSYCHDNPYQPAIDHSKFLSQSSLVFCEVAKAEGNNICLLLFSLTTNHFFLLACLSVERVEVRPTPSTYPHSLREPQETTPNGTWMRYQSKALRQGDPNESSQVKT